MFWRRRIRQYSACAERRRRAYSFASDMGVEGYRIVWYKSEGLWRCVWRWRPSDSRVSRHLGESTSPPAPKDVLIDACPQWTKSPSLVSGDHCRQTPSRRIQYDRIRLLDARIFDLFVHVAAIIILPWPPASSGLPLLPSPAGIVTDTARRRKPISLISHSDVRYRGILAGIDPAASTIQLSNGASGHVWRFARVAKIDGSVLDGD